MQLILSLVPSNSTVLLINRVNLSFPRMARKVTSLFISKSKKKGSDSISNVGFVD